MSRWVLIRDSEVTYILIIIDVLSKHAWAMSLKAKDEMTKAIIKIIRDDRRCLKNLQTDSGNELYNSDVQKLLKKRNINHYSTNSVIKASIIERYNRTLKNDICNISPPPTLAFS